MKKTNGITLIALVITIIVLLILAGISISMLSGDNSILSKATEAKNKTIKAQGKEIAALKMTEVLMKEEWNGEISESFEGSGTEQEPYLIKNGADLAYLAKRVNDGNKCTGEVYKITEDINLGNKEWIPIGYGTSGNYFNGTLDGQDNIITGIKVSSAEMQQTKKVGLFGYVGSKGVLKNIIIHEGQISGLSYVGGIVGDLRGKAINCKNGAKKEEKEKRDNSTNGSYVRRDCRLYKWDKCNCGKLYK